MIPKLWCLIFGHKRTARVNTRIENDLVLFDTVTKKYCDRCGKYLGEWWVKK